MAHYSTVLPCLTSTGPAKPAANSAKLKPSRRSITRGERRYYYRGIYFFTTTCILVNTSHKKVITLGKLSGVK